ncbi:MAG: hypothetical protein JNL73_15720 [Anaerolineales bacterium]|nr:hypothetical protein [Anaerolineales bacterium]
MRVYLALKYFEDQRNRPFVEEASRALAQRGLDVYCVARDLEGWGAVVVSPRDLMRASLAALQGCDVVWVDLSEKGVGLGIEAGYGHAIGKPLLITAPRGTEVSTTLTGIADEIVDYADVTEAVAGVARFCHARSNQRLP